MLSKVVLFIVAICLTKTGVYGEHIIEVNDYIRHSNEEFPDFTYTSDSWLFGNPQAKGALLVDCTVNFQEAKDCSAAYFKISDDVKTDVLCENSVYRMHSKYNSVKIELNILKKGFGVAYYCDFTAMAWGRVDESGEGTEEPIHSGSNYFKPLHWNNIEVKVSDSIANKDINGNLSSGLNAQYKFVAEKHQIIDIICSIHPFGAGMPVDDCKFFKLNVVSGTRKRSFCKTSNYFNFITEGNTLRVSITTGDQVSGYINCDVQATKKLKYSHYKNMPTEELDSSEFGVRGTPRRKETTCDCGWANKETKRIVFGQHAGLHEFTWAVSLQYTANGNHFCGGSIITPYHVLTAAHCVPSMRPNELVVVMGSHNSNDKTLSSEVNAVFTHSNYSQKMTYAYDIAILELKSEIKYTQFVGPICLPAVDPQIVFQSVTAMGWGLFDESENLRMEIMKKTTLKVIDIESCTFEWGFFLDVIDPKFICTWNTTSDVCKGDSGGPLVWHDPAISRYTLVGLPSVSDSCKMVLPSIHTAVDYHYKWILETIKKSSKPNVMPCTRID